MWYDQSDEIIVYEHNMPSNLVRSIRPSSLLASPHTIWKRLALQLMVGRASLHCRNNVRHSICLSTFNAYQEQNTVWENYQRNCHVILFTLRQNIEFLAFRSICVYERLCVRLSPLLLPLMNLCSWVTVRLFSRFSAAFRNFCPSPSECTGGKHLPGISFYMCKCFHQIISDKIKYLLYS